MKKSIVLSILPIFALASCSKAPEEQSVDRYTSPAPESGVVENGDGSYSKDADQLLQQSYEQAKASGYKGSYDEWVEISKLQETNPKLAQEKAESNGFSGGEMMLAALAGMAIGGLAAKAYNGSDNTSRSHSQQRLNNTTNYASVQKYNEDKNRRDSSYGSTGTAFAGGSVAANSNKKSSVSLSKKGNSASGAFRSSGTAVVRGGFGGSAVGHGG
jgi:hypothetical protein